MIVQWVQNLPGTWLNQAQFLAFHMVPQAFLGIIPEDC